MRKYNQLKKKTQHAVVGAKEDIENLYTIAEESARIANVAHDARIIINDIDKKFTQATKLNRVDISVLFLGTALQCARIYLLTNEKLRISNTQGDKLMENTIGKTVPKSWKNILFQSVPYDAFFTTDNFKESIGSIGVSGKTHRYRTIGHDPVLGWIFGPINILSDSLTKMDMVSTYQVDMPYVIGSFPNGTYGALKCAMKQAQMDRYNFPAAVMRQAIHFGSDYFTKQGLPVPFLSTINNDLSKDLLIKYNIDMWSITRGTALSMLINRLIACIHQLFYDCHIDGNLLLYQVRTRKILSYSNLMATSSNILYVAFKKELKKIDVGGIIVTLYRLISDYKFINNLKREFLEKEFYNIVMGNEYDF